MPKLSNFWFIFGAFCLVLSGSAEAQSTSFSTPIDLSLAESYFEELRDVVTKDHGKLWGIPLVGPVIFVDPATRTVVANSEGGVKAATLTRRGSVYVGSLGNDVLIANTSVQWEGQHWAMIMWPLPDERLERQTLMVHESWHRIQSEIPIASSGDANEHLDSMEARICLRMEWLSLARALELDGQLCRQAIEDAILFRTLRRKLYPGASSEENRMELHEGLAEYTGIRLGAEDQARRVVSTTLRSRPEQLVTMVRSFGYLSGPAYGLLLDDHLPGWRKQIIPTSDLGEMLRSALDLKLSNELEQQARKRISAYDGMQMVQFERAREMKRILEQRRLRVKFVEGPILVLPLSKMSMTFDPSRNTPVQGIGTVYGNLVVNDQWGKLNSTGEALITRDFKRLIVPASENFKPADRVGEDWEMVPSREIRIVRGRKENQWVLE